MYSNDFVNPIETSKSQFGSATETTITVNIRPIKRIKLSKNRLHLLTENDSSTLLAFFSQ